MSDEVANLGLLDGLVHYYKMDELSGTRHDCHGNGRGWEPIEDEVDTPIVVIVIGAPK